MFLSIYRSSSMIFVKVFHLVDPTISAPTIYASISLFHSSQLTARLLTAHTAFRVDLCRLSALVVDVSQQSTLVERLGARRHVDSRVLREEVDGLEADFEDLAGHYGEVFDARDLLGVCVWLVMVGCFFFLG